MEDPKGENGRTLSELGHSVVYLPELQTDLQAKYLRTGEKIGKDVAAGTARAVGVIDLDRAFGRRYPAWVV